MSKLLLSRGDVEAEYGVPKRWLELAAHKGGGPTFIKVGSRVYYRRSDLERWLAERRRRSTSDPGPDPEEAERIARERLAEAGGTGGAE